MKIMSECKLTGARTDGIRLSISRYIAIVYHSINDEKRRRTLAALAEKIEKCKIPMLKVEQELFFNSMIESENIPNLTKCIHKNDLILCYLRRELEWNNWKNLKELLSLYPMSIPLYDHIDAFLVTAKNQNVSAEEITNVIMEYAKVHNPYFMEKSDFKTIMKKVLNACSFVAKESTKAFEKIERKCISLEESETLKNAIDEYVHGSKEAFVKTQEYEKVVSWVSKWKKINKVEDSKNVVVVDALNFGRGHDPVEWKNISAEFEHVVFATRNPPRAVRDKVLKKYAGNAMFCDKLSADDLIILRMALEFGPESSLVTNDQYRDHRKAVCNGDPVLEKIWDDFLINAVYRHHDHRIESRRDFNIQVLKVNGQWVIPVMDSEGDTPKMRNLKVYTIGKQSQKKLKGTSIGGKVSSSCC